MNKDNVDVQDYLDDMVDGFVGDEATNEEYEQAQALASQAFCFGLEHKQQEIKSLKAQLGKQQEALKFADSCFKELKEVLEKNKAQLAQLEAELLKPQSDDYVLVPKKPTNTMIDAVRAEHEGEPYLPYSIYEAFIEQAMIEAQEQDM